MLSYGKITKEANIMITRLLEDAADAKNAGYGHVEEMRRHYAFGVYLLWFGLTATSKNKCHATNSKRMCELVGIADLDS
jgi:hypothetical protein